MKYYSDDDLERIYAGWLGKVIGVRYGSLVEMWDSEEIRQKFSDVDGYFMEYHDYASDDDLNGPLFFYRALRDCKDYKNYGYKDVAYAWKNYVPYEHGFLWWGGYGVSEEHTAYLNLLKGINPPVCGSSVQNGLAMSEQIGGQIFIDTWGLVALHNPKKAAELAEIAAGVSHDGEAIYGGMYVAAMIASAFDAKDTREIINTALKVIPKNCAYAKMVKDIIGVHDSGVSQEECFQYIKTNYWKDKYGGNCHIIPNAAIMTYSLLYGENDYIKTLKIALYSGFDTDCNVGNLGTVMGVYTKLKGVDYKTWIKPINDVVCCSSVLGSKNITSISKFAYDLFKTAMKLNKCGYKGKYKKYLKDDFDDATYTFALPYASNGLKTDGNVDFSFDGENLKITGNGHAYFKTYYGVKDFEDNRYDPAVTAKVFNGETIHIDYEMAGNMDVTIYVEDYHTGIKYYGKPNEKKYRINIPKDVLIYKAGLEIKGEGGYILLKSFKVDGKANYRMDFNKEINEYYTLYHNEVSSCTYYKGTWHIENGRLTGRCLDDGRLYTGKPMKDFSFATKMTFLKNNTGGIAFKVSGNVRQYQLLIEDNKAKLIKIDDEKIILDEKEIGLLKSYDMKVVSINNEIRVFINRNLIFDYTDENMLNDGSIGALTDKGSVVSFDKFEVKEL